MMTFYVGLGVIGTVACLIVAEMAGVYMPSVIHMTPFNRVSSTFFTYFFLGCPIIIWWGITMEIRDWRQFSRRS